MKQLRWEPGVPGLAGQCHCHHGPGVFLHGDLDIEHEASLLRVRDTGDLTSEGAIATPAWLQRPGLRAGRGRPGAPAGDQCRAAPDHWPPSTGAERCYCQPHLGGKESRQEAGSPHCSQSSQTWSARPWPKILQIKKGMYTYL